MNSNQVSPSQPDAGQDPVKLLVMRSVNEKERMSRGYGK
jgi:hypothetical protein